MIENQEICVNNHEETTTPQALEIDGISFYPANQMPEVELPPVEWFIEGLFARKKKHTLMGLPKEGKGHLVEQLGICLAEGLPFLDCVCTGRYRVLYLEFESDDSTLVERIEPKREALNAEGSNFIYKRYPGAMHLDTKNGLEDLKQILKGFENAGQPIDMLVLDPKYKLFAGDQNQNNVVTEWTDKLDELIHTFDIGMLVINHVGKHSYGNFMKKGMGSILFNAWMDVVIGLKSDKQGNQLVGGELHVDGKIPETLSLHLKFDPTTLLFELDPAEKADKKFKYQRARDVILIEVQSGDIEEAKLKSKVREQGIGHTTFHKALKSVIAEGKIESIAYNKNKRLLKSRNCGEVC